MIQTSATFKGKGKYIHQHKRELGNWKQLK